MEILFRMIRNNPGNTPGLFSFLLCTYLLFTAIPDVHSQESYSGKFYPTAGITWRSAAMNFFNFDYVWPDDFSRPYDYERNVQGFSLNIGIQYQLSNTLVVEYYPNLRYDVIYHRWDKKYDELIGITNDGDSLFTNDNPINIKEFIIDHNFNIMRKKGRLAYGLGMTIVNTGKSFKYPNSYRAPNPIYRYQSLEFKAYNAFVTFPLKNIFNLELKAMYIPKDFPYNQFEKYIMYSMRVYYRFKSLN